MYVVMKCTEQLQNCGYKFEAVESTMTALFRCTNNRWSDSVKVTPYQYIDVNCTKPLGNCGYKFEAVKSSMTALFRCTTQPLRPASVIDIPYQDVVVKCTKRLRNCRYKFEAVVAMDLCINALEVLNDLANLKLPPGEKLTGWWKLGWFTQCSVVYTDWSRLIRRV